MTLDIVTTRQFRRDYRLLKKRGYDMSRLDDVYTRLSNEEALPENYRDHQLQGNYAGYRECRIAPDWLLVYRVDGDILVLVLSRTGTMRTSSVELSRSVRQHPVHR